MIRFFVLIIAIALIFNGVACHPEIQIIQWRWLSGASSANQHGICGSRGQYDASYVPGARYNFGMTRFSNGDGTMYIYAGRGHSTSGSEGYLGDIWGYKQTLYFQKGHWAWLGGLSDVINYDPEYMGPTPNPGARVAPIAWNYASLLYIYGGKCSSGLSTDVWAFNVTSNVWQFVKGSLSLNDKAKFGIKGIVGNTDRPGGIEEHSLLHSSNDGLMCFFGGHGYDSSTSGYVSDTWQFHHDVNRWAWINGPSTVNKPSIPGPLGVFSPEYTPGGRRSQSVLGLWHGVVYVYGGYGRVTSSTTVSADNLADLWGFRLVDSAWAWIGGEVDNQNILSSYVDPQHPGARREGTGWVSGDNGFIFGGMGFDTANLGYLSDVWALDFHTMAWEWIGGESVGDSLGYFNDSDWYSDSNQPPGLQRLRSGINLEIDAIYLFGGRTYSPSGYESSNALWSTPPMPRRESLHVTQWKLMSGSKLVNQHSVCGTAGLYSDKYTPGARYYAAMSPRACDGVVWLFGGSGYSVNAQGDLGDVWCYSKASEWAWMGGDSALVNQHSTYTEKPGSRDGCVVWCSGTSMYLFGGNGYASSGAGNRRLNDVWKFDSRTMKWSWLLGSSLIDQFAEYGVFGSPDIFNTPGGVQYHSLIAMNTTTAIKFGGSGFDTAGSGPLSDVWSYDIHSNMWTWIAGPSLRDQASFGGPQGVFSTAYFPGGRQWCSVMMNGDVTYIYSGSGRTTPTKTGYLADLWAFSTTTTKFAFIAGDSVRVNVKGYHGELASYAPVSNVGSRFAGAGWSNTGDLIYIFGGDGFTEITGTMPQYLGDLWVLNITTNRWAWTGGFSAENTYGVYNDSTNFSDENIPGCRYGHSVFVSNGLMYLFGGHGYSERSVGFLNDVLATRGSTFQRHIIPTSIPRPSPQPHPQQPLQRFGVAYSLGLVMSVIMTVTVAVPLIATHAVNGHVKALGAAVPCIYAIQHMGVTSQYAVPMTDTYADFASAFSWTLPVISSPTPTTSRRRLLSLAMFGSTHNVLPNILLFIVIITAVVGLYVVIANRLRRNKKIEHIPMWRKWIGLCLRITGIIYYAVCWAALCSLSHVISDGYTVLAVLVLLGIGCGYPLLCILKLRNIAKYPDSTKTQKFIIVYGGFFTGLQANRHWYAVFIIAMKLFIAICTTVITLIHLQASFLCIIHVTYLFILARFKPYLSRLRYHLWILHGTLQLLSQCVLWALSTAPSEAVGVIQIIAMCSIQGTMITIFVNQTMDAMGIRISSRVMRCLSCGLSWRWCREEEAEAGVIEGDEYRLMESNQ